MIFNNLNLSTKIKLNEIFCKFNFKVFFNKNEFVKYFVDVLKTNEILKNNELLKYLKLTNNSTNSLIKKLTNDELILNINLLKSPDYYETFEFLIDFVKLTKEITFNFFDVIFDIKTILTPKSTKKQN